MARDIGPKIGIDGEKEYLQQINQIIQQGRTLAAEMKAVTASFTKETSAEQKAEKTGKILSAQIDNQRQRVAALRDMVDKSSKATGENSNETLKWREALANAEATLASLEKQTDETGSEIEDLSDAESDSAKAAKNAASGSSGFGDTLKALVASNVIGAIVDGLKQLAVEMVGFIKDAVLSYGELEQALGGSEAVFGEYAAAIQASAKTAWETMGQSETEYLSAANKIGALLQGSGMSTQEAYETTIAVMQRAVDVASVMGVDVASAFDAVTGAAKGNYSMMDNLGVKMDEATLAAYALENGETAVWSELSNTSKAEWAMAYFLEQTQKYAGNFVSEAQNTVSGSIETVKASVANWIAGLGDSEADIATLTANMMGSFETAANNIKPIIENIVQNLALSLKEAWPTISAVLVGLLGDLDGVLAEWGASVSTALDKLITTIGTGITEAWASFITSLGEFGTQVQTALADMINAISTAISGIVEAAKTWGADMINNFISGIQSMWTDFTKTLNSWAETVAKFIGFSEPEKGPLSNFHTYAPDMMKLFSEGVLENQWRVTDALTEAFDVSPIIESSAQGAVTNFGGVTLNVYADGPVDGDSLYETFVHRLQLDTMDREAVFAS